MSVSIRMGNSSERFKPHMNEALGQYIHTKEDYLRLIKKHGLIPQKEAQKIAEAKRREQDKPYKASKWAHDMVGEIQRSGGKPGGVFYSELSKKGYNVKKMKQMEAAKKKASRWTKSGKAGFSND